MALIFAHLDALATFGADCADLHQSKQPYWQANSLEVKVYLNHHILLIYHGKEEEFKCSSTNAKYISRRKLISVINHS